MIDLFVVIGYICFIFIIALKSKMQQGEQIDLKAQYLANNELSFSDSLYSIIATEVSALTFIGIPAFAYTKNFSFIYIYFGAIFGRLVIARFILPNIYGKGLTLYEVIAKKRSSSSNSRALLSAIYLLGRILGVGVRLYAGSILISEFFEIQIFMAVLLTATCTYFYTLIGGLRAVVKTDKLQMLVFIIGGLLAHYYIASQSVMNWSDLAFLAYQNEKIFSFDLIEFISGLSIGVLGGIVFDIATHGMDQDFIQRLMGCRSLKDAQNAIQYSSILSIFVGLLFLSIGAILWSHYSLVGFPDIANQDRIFAYFITTNFPTGLKGLMLAGVLAATMSTLDSTLNAVGSCLSNDIFKRKEKDLSFRVLALDSAVIMSLLLLVAILSSQVEGVLEVGLKVASWVGGGLLAIYLSQFTNFLKSSLSSFLVLSLMAVNLISVYFYSYNGGVWQFNVHIGCFSALFVLWSFEKVKSLISSN